MMTNVDRLAEDWYRKWDPEFDDDEDDDEDEDEENEENENEELGDCDEFDIAREDALIFDEGAGK